MKVKNTKIIDRAAPTHSTKRSGHMDPTASARVQCPSDESHHIRKMTPLLVLLKKF